MAITNYFCLIARRTAINNPQIVGRKTVAEELALIILVQRPALRKRFRIEEPPLVVRRWQDNKKIYDFQLFFNFHTIQLHFEK
jgi:hypothetical protein